MLAAKANTTDLTTTSSANSIRGQGKPFFPNPVIQPKLTINEPGDRYEQEGDATAERIMRMPVTTPIAKPFYSPAPAVIQRCDCDKEEIHRKESSISTLSVIPDTGTPIQRKCSACEEEEKIQRKETNAGAPLVTNTVTQVLTSSGQPLDAGTRNFMESRFGNDFSNVRIHNDSMAHRSSADINARAYTNGTHIVFGNGEYNPFSLPGKQLLAHELTHVVQQTARSGIKNILSRQPAAPDQCQEKKYQDLLAKPLPWGIQEGDKSADIATKRTNTMRDPDFLYLTNNCIRVHATRYVSHAEGVTLQQIIDGINSGKPFPIVSKIKDGRTYEAIADPRPLATTRQLDDMPAYRITGDDASAGAVVNMPGLTTPQCGDQCAAADRALTFEQFTDPDTPLRSCCSTKECGTINTRITEAREYTTRTIDRLRRGLSMDNALASHFRKNDPATYQEVLQKLNRILPDLSFSRHEWLCRQHGSAAELCMSIKRARATIGGRADAWRILMCMNNGDTPFEHVLHEITHSTFAGTTEVYYKEEGYPPPNALDNADSFAMFVKEVGELDWKEEQHAPLSLSGLAGVSFRDRRIRSVYGVHAELTPFGRGIRAYDLVAGGTILWSPAHGAIPEDKSASHKFEFGLDAILRLRPTRSFYVDVGVGALLKVPDTALEIDPRLAVSWKPGGGSSGIKFTAEMRAIYDEAQAKPDNFIFTVGIGYEAGGEPRRRPKMNP